MEQKVPYGKEPDATTCSPMRFTNCQFSMCLTALTPKDSSEAKDADLRASMVALQRASLLARQNVIQSDTHFMTETNQNQLHKQYHRSDPPSQSSLG